MINALSSFMPGVSKTSPEKSESEIFWSFINSDLKFGMMDFKPKSTSKFKVHSSDSSQENQMPLTTVISTMKLVSMIPKVKFWL